MKFIVLFFSTCLSALPVFVQADPSSDIPQKTILVISSKGGYGHTAAANTLTSLFGDRYKIKVIHPIDELHFFGIPMREDIYNAMLSNGWIRSMNFISRHLAPYMFRSNKEKIEELMTNYIHEEKPDIIISLIPFINYPASEAAKKCDVPYLLITTDYDLKNWVLDLNEITHPDFKVTIGSDLPTTKDRLIKQGIPEKSIETIGLPLRLDFLKSPSLAELKAAYNIPENKQVVLIIMGGAGSKSALEYAKRIASMDLSLHLIVCTGKDKKLGRRIKKIHLHPSNSLLVMGFTEKIADLMAISDLIITKPGPGTINEAMALHVPVLLDGTMTPLYWEKANMDLVVHYGIGSRINKYKDTQEILKEFLTDPKLRNDLEARFSQIPANRFHERILLLVDSMSSRKECPAEEAAR